MAFSPGLKRWRHAGIALAVGACATLMSATPLTVVAAPAATAPTCSAASCVGKDPVTVGCVNGAKVELAQTTRSGGNITLLYSPACHAAWGQQYEIPNANVPEVLYLFVAPKHGGPETPVTTSASVGTTYRTTMVNWDDTIKICFWWNKVGTTVADPAPDPARDNTTNAACTRWI
jgi:hypothetical protein